LQGGLVLEEPFERLAKVRTQVLPLVYLVNPVLLELAILLPSRFPVCCESLGLQKTEDLCCVFSFRLPLLE
jgi:hypothetical protein